MTSNLPAVDTAYTDLSGITATSENPYDALIKACGNDAVSYEQCYCHFGHSSPATFGFVGLVQSRFASPTLKNTSVDGEEFRWLRPAVFDVLMDHDFSFHTDTIQAQIQLRYDTHRKTRNEQQRAKLLAPDFSGFVIDPILYQLVNPQLFPAFADPRHCLVFWARPPQSVRALIHQVQQKLRAEVPSQTTYLSWICHAHTAQIYGSCLLIVCT